MRLRWCLWSSENILRMGQKPIAQSHTHKHLKNENKTSAFCFKTDRRESFRLKIVLMCSIVKQNVRFLLKCNLRFVLYRFEHYYRPVCHLKKMLFLLRTEPDQRQHATESRMSVAMAPIGRNYYEWNGLECLGASEKDGLEERGSAHASVSRSIKTALAQPNSHLSYLILCNCIKRARKTQKTTNNLKSEVESISLIDPFNWHS